MVKAGPTPAFVLARVFAADGAGVAAYVRYRSSSGLVRMGGLLLRGEAIVRCLRRRSDAIRMRCYWCRHSGVGSPTLHRNPRAELSPRW